MVREAGEGGGEERGDLGSWKCLPISILFDVSPYIQHQINVLAGYENLVVSFTIVKNNKQTRTNLGMNPAGA